MALEHSPLALTTYWPAGTSTCATTTGAPGGRNVARSLGVRVRRAAAAGAGVAGWSGGAVADEGQAGRRAAAAIVIFVVVVVAAGVAVMVLAAAPAGPRGFYL